MDRREIKSAIDSIQPNPGMELRIRHAVLQRKGKTGGRAKPQPRFFQGSIIAAACCVLAAIVIMTTAMLNGSFSGIRIGPTGGDNCCSEGQTAPGAQGSQPDQAQVEVTLEDGKWASAATSGAPVYFQVTATGAPYVSVQTDRGGLEQLDNGTSKVPDTQRIGSGAHLCWDPSLEGSERAVAAITAYDGDSLLGNSKYLIISRDGQTGEVTTRICDRADG